MWQNRGETQGRFVFNNSYEEGYMLGMGYVTPLGNVRLMPGNAQY